MILFLGLTALAAWTAWRIARDVHWSAGGMVFWIALSALRIFAAPESPFRAYGKLAMTSADGLSAQAGLSVLLVVAALLIASARAVEMGLMLTAFIAFGDAVWITARAALHWSSFEARGLFDNASLDGCFVAIALPYMRLRARWFCLFAVIVTGSSSALLAAMLPVLFRSWLAPPVGIIAFGAYGRELLNSNGRFNIWRIAFEWWTLNIDPVVGSGLGTFFLLGPHAQIMRGQDKTGIFTVMHSDWLQVLFEQGWIGLALAIVLFTMAYLASKPEAATRRALVALGAAATINMPFHFLASAFLGTLIIRRSFDVSER